MKTKLQVKLLQYILIRDKTAQGFTLLELLVVIVIIGILSAIALPSFLNQANKAKESEAKTYVSSFNKAQTLYRLENPGFATTLNQLSITIPPSTDFYNYTIGGSGTITNLTASAKDPNSLRGFSGGVTVLSATGQTQSVACQTEQTQQVHPVASIGAMTTSCLVFSS
ncbi:prepilin-type N-terminal cleavage/methylation domain-containing protein [Cylindrospermopsis raciborskii LB2897]|nr:prepilin-type N-terminal cleavage/methylation domain-containing protein [Cylindrospermopsis raciborskii LB2897]